MQQSAFWSLSTRKVQVLEYGTGIRSFPREHNALVKERVSHQSRNIMSNGTLVCILVAQSKDNYRTS